jgi:TP53 regulating kinase-like protein
VGTTPCVCKERFSKKYRLEVLDKKITKARVLAESRCLAKARKAGIDTPAIYQVDVAKGSIYLEFISGNTVRSYLAGNQGQNVTAAHAMAVAAAMGMVVAKLHNANIIHGDLTTSNFMLRVAPPTTTDANASSSSEGEAAAAASYKPQVLPIDFGLSQSGNASAEDKAVDLYVLERAFASTHANSEALVAEVLRQYKASCSSSDSVGQKLAAVRARGRKRECFG